MTKTISLRADLIPRRTMRNMNSKNLVRHGARMTDGARRFDSRGGNQAMLRITFFQK